MWCRGRRALRGPSVVSGGTPGALSWLCLFALALGPQSLGPASALLQTDHLLMFLQDTAWGCSLTAKQDAVFCERSKVCGWAQHLGAGTCPRPSLWVSPSVLGASPQLGMKVSAARCIFCMPGFPSLVLLPCFPVMFSPMAQDPPC